MTVFETYDPSDAYYGLFAGMSLGVVLLFTLISYALSALIMSFLFRKAGIPMWKAWVPVYSQYVFLELGGINGWWVLLSLAAFIPFLGFIASIALLVLSCMSANVIAHDLGKNSGWWVVLYLFIPILWFLILGLDDSVYRGRGNQIPSW